ncbi:MAG TPA: hypothetical protein VGH79_00155 [Gaiellaceae bacterium]|jgi:hypothetical protein
MRSLTFPFRRALAALVLLGTGFGALSLSESTSQPPAYLRPLVIPQPSIVLAPAGPPWWEIATAVAVGILAAVAVYPRRASAESWVKGFRTTSVFHRPLPARTD